MDKRAFQAYQNELNRPAIKAVHINTLNGKNEAKKSRRAKASSKPSIISTMDSFPKEYDRKDSIVQQEKRMVGDKEITITYMQTNNVLIQDKK